MMKYVKLGRTGLEAAVISFGGIPIQRSDCANTWAVVDKLEEYGINYIDTARGYTVSEEYLGAALEGRRDSFILATKSMARDYAGMSQDVEISLSNLRTNYIDLYQLHNLPEKDFELAFGGGGAYRALSEAKAAGKIGHIGVTAHSLDALKRLVEEYGADRFTVEPDGRLRFTGGFPDADSILSWVLTFGDKAELLEPQELREQLGDLTETLADRYRGKN